MSLNRLFWFPLFRFFSYLQDADLIHSINKAGVLSILRYLTLILFPPDSEDTKQLVTEVYYNLAKYGLLTIFRFFFECQ
jgi:CRISPR/Cas system CSM-associated protein Csm4 (group 5 of RAMP superfamily)